MQIEVKLGPVDAAAIAVVSKIAADSEDPIGVVAATRVAELMGRATTKAAILNGQTEDLMEALDEAVNDGQLEADNAAEIRAEIREVAEEVEAEAEGRVLIDADEIARAL